MRHVARLLQRRAKPLVGVDVDNTHVRLLELDRPHSECRVRAYASAELPAGAVQNRQIIEAESVATTIAAAFKRSGTRCREVAVAVPDAVAFRKIISIPAQSDTENIEQWVLADAAGHIPYDISEVNFDFHTLGPAPDDPTMTRVLLVACRRDYIELLCAVFEMAGARIRIIDVESLALQNACHYLPQTSNGPSAHTPDLVIFDIAGPRVRMHVRQGQAILHSREMDFDARELIRSLEASSSEPQNKSNSASTDLPHKSALNLATRINDALDFHRAVAGNDQADIGHVLLTGIAATHIELKRLLARHVKKPVAFGNPLSDVPIGDGIIHSAIEADAPKLMVATGLALRQIA